MSLIVTETPPSVVGSRPLFIDESQVVWALARPLPLIVTHDAGAIGDGTTKLPPLTTLVIWGASAGALFRVTETTSGSFAASSVRCRITVAGSCVRARSAVGAAVRVRVVEAPGLTVPDGGSTVSHGALGTARKGTAPPMAPMVTVAGANGRDGAKVTV